MAPANTADEVKQCIAGFAGVSTEILKDETSLFHDLGMDGDDAHDFMQEFASRFQVDLAHFVFSDYFGAEAATNPLALLTGALGLTTAQQFKRLEIKCLIQAVLQGHFLQ